MLTIFYGTRSDRRRMEGNVCLTLVRCMQQCQIDNARTLKSPLLLIKHTSIAMLQA